MKNFPYQLTDHASERLNKRNIKLEWIEQVIQPPIKTEPYEFKISELLSAQYSEFYNFREKLIHTANQQRLNYIYVVCPGF